MAESQDIPKAEVEPMATEAPVPVPEGTLPRPRSRSRGPLSIVVRTLVVSASLLILSLLAVIGWWLYTQNQGWEKGLKHVPEVLDKPKERPGAGGG
jgi:hypothetical protein